MGPDGKLYFCSATAASTSPRRKGRSSSIPTPARCCAATRTAATWRSSTPGCATRRSWPSTTTATSSPATTTPTPATGRGGSTSSRAATAAGACGYQYGTGYHTPSVPQGNRGPWNTEKLWHAAARRAGRRTSCRRSLNFGNGPAGITHYPGVGLNDKYKDHFFACDFTGEPRGSSVIWTLAVKPKGAAFEVSEAAAVRAANMVPTDCEFGPDGAFYWSRLDRRLGQAGQGPHLPRHRPRGDEEPGGGRGEEAARGGVREEERSRNWRSCWNTRTSRCGRRRSSNWRRESRKRRSEAFAGVLKESKNQLARLHAVWGLGMVARAIDPDRLQSVVALVDRDRRTPRSEVSRAAEQLGERRQPRHRSKLTLGRLRTEAMRVDSSRTDVTDPTPACRPPRRSPTARSASQPQVAVTPAGRASFFAPLFDLLEDEQRQGPVPPPRRGDGARPRGSQPGGSICGTSWTHGEGASTTSPAVRMGVLLALRKHKSDKVAEFLTDTEPRIVAEAARAIYDERMMNSSRRWRSSRTRRPRPDAVAFRALAANYWLGTPEAAARVAKFAGRAERAGLHSRLRAQAARATGPKPPRATRSPG